VDPLGGTLSIDQQHPPTSRNVRRETEFIGTVWLFLFLGENEIVTLFMGW